MSTPYGNYAHYYTKRQVSLIHGDPRVGLLPPAWVQGKVVLDIGCNSGAVSVEIAQKLSPSRVVGVDIDPELIRKAETHLAYNWSLQAPSRTPQPAGEPSHPVRSEPNYFPISLPKTHGFVPLPPPSPTDDPSSPPPFPNNITFHTANYVLTTPPSTPESYDLILAFSITKWIHLHHLDAGLIAFFTKIFDSLNPGGRFVLEKQGWGGYRDGAKKGGGDLKAKLATLELRPDGFADELSKIGFVEETPLRSEGDQDAAGGGGKEKGFERAIEVFRKPLLLENTEEVEMEVDSVDGGEKKKDKKDKKAKRKCVDAKPTKAAGDSTMR